MAVGFVPATMGSPRVGLVDSSHIAFDETFCGRTQNAAEIPLGAQNPLVHLEQKEGRERKWESLAAGLARVLPRCYPYVFDCKKGKEDCSCREEAERVHSEKMGGATQPLAGRHLSKKKHGQGISPIVPREQ